MLAFTTRDDKDVESMALGEMGLSYAGLAGESGIRIRAMREADLERILELRSSVSWAADPRAFDLLRGMRDARWAVAEDRHGRLVGMVGAVPLGRIGILCHLAVREGYRNKGIGAGLTSWATTYLRSRGVTVIRLYSTPEAESIYRSSGFVTVSTRTVYQLEGEPLGWREPAPEHCVELLTSEDMTELYGVDRWSYGADRSALILAILRLNPGRGLVARNTGGGISGYLIRSESSRGTRIGPFMAASPEVARLLLSRALDGTEGMPAEVTVTGDGPAHALLRDFGFSGCEDRRRMEIGVHEPKLAGLEQYGTTPYLAT